MTNFPTSADSYTNPTEFDLTNGSGVELWQLITDLQDAVEALEAYILSGTGAGTEHYRFKDGFIWLKDTSGGGTPWHKLYLESVDDIWTMKVEPTGEA